MNPHFIFYSSGLIKLVKQFQVRDEIQSYFETMGIEIKENKQIAVNENIIIVRKLVS